MIENNEVAAFVPQAEVQGARKEKKHEGNIDMGQRATELKLQAEGQIRVAKDNLLHAEEMLAKDDLSERLRTAAEMLKAAAEADIEEVNRLTSELTMVTTQINELDQDLESPNEPETATTADIGEEGKEMELPTISSEAKKSIERMVNNIDRTGEALDPDAGPTHILHDLMEKNDPKAAAGILEHFTAALDTKRNEKKSGALETYDFQQMTALGGVLNKAHLLQSRGIEVNQNMIDKIAGSFLRAANASLREAEPSKINQMLSERESLVQEIQKELNARLIAGESIPANLEKDYAEFLQILKTNDAEVQQYQTNESRDPLKKPPTPFLKGYEFADSGMYDVIQYRFKGKELKKPENVSDYIDRSHDAYVAISKKYGLEAPTKPAEEKDDESNWTF